MKVKNEFLEEEIELSPTLIKILEENSVEDRANFFKAISSIENKEEREKVLAGLNSIKEEDEKGKAVLDKLIKNGYLLKNLENFKDIIPLIDIDNLDITILELKNGNLINDEPFTLSNGVTVSNSASVSNSETEQINSNGGQEQENPYKKINRATYFNVQSFNSPEIVGVIDGNNFCSSEIETTNDTVKVTLSHSSNGEKPLFETIKHFKPGAFVLDITRDNTTNEYDDVYADRADRITTFKIPGENIHGMIVYRGKIVDEKGNILKENIPEIILCDKLGQPLENFENGFNRLKELIDDDKFVINFNGVNVLKQVQLLQPQVDGSIVGYEDETTRTTLESSAFGNNCWVRNTRENELDGTQTTIGLAKQLKQFLRDKDVYVNLEKNFGKLVKEPEALLNHFNVGELNYFKVFGKLSTKSVEARKQSSFVENRKGKENNESVSL